MSEPGRAPVSAEPENSSGEEELRLPPWRWILKLLLLIVGVFFAAMVFLNFVRQIKDLIVIVAASLFLSFALEPAVSYLYKRGMRRGLATFLILFAVALVGILMLVLMVPVLVDQLVALVRAGPAILDTLTEYSKRWFGLDLSGQNLQDTLNNASSSVSSFSGNIAGNLFGAGAALVAALFKLLSTALFTFYLVADGPRFRRTVCSVLPPKQQETVLETWEVAIDKTGAYLYSRVVLALFSGVSTYAVLRLLEVPYALPLAFWMGLVSQFIPTVGTYIAMALPLLVALVQGPGDALVLLVFFTLYQQLENYIFSPRVTARTMELHPALAFGAAIAGASVGGVVGAFLALPAAAIIQAVASTYLHRHEVVETALTMPELEPEGTEPEQASKVRAWRERFRRRDDQAARGS